MIVTADIRVPVVFQLNRVPANFSFLFFSMLKIACFIVFPTVFPSNNGHLEFQTRAMINVLVFCIHAVYIPMRFT